MNNAVVYMLFLAQETILQQWFAKWNYSIVKESMKIILSYEEEWK